MFVNKQHNQYFIAGMLFVLMIATRFHHFGSVTHLPDASLAIFFLAGLYLKNRSFFIVYLLEAGLIDYLAISNGASDWCISPAYGFLIPTYFVLWFGGRWFSSRCEIGVKTIVPLLLSVCIATTVAFFISNGSFYLFSGRFPDLVLSEYILRTKSYYWPYISNCIWYVLGAWLIHCLLSSITVQQSTNTGLNH